MGKIDFEIFIKLVGLVGVRLWEVDLFVMKVIYIDNMGNDLIVELILSI